MQELSEQWNTPITSATGESSRLQSPPRNPKITSVAVACLEFYSAHSSEDLSQAVDHVEALLSRIGLPHEELPSARAIQQAVDRRSLPPPSVTRDALPSRPSSAPVAIPFAGDLRSELLPLQVAQPPEYSAPYTTPSCLTGAETYAVFTSQLETKKALLQEARLQYESLEKLFNETRSRGESVDDIEPQKNKALAAMKKLEVQIAPMYATKEFIENEKNYNLILKNMIDALTSAIGSGAPKVDFLKKVLREIIDLKDASDQLLEEIELSAGDPQKLARVLQSETFALTMQRLTYFCSHYSKRRTELERQPFLGKQPPLKDILASSFPGSLSSESFADAYASPMQRGARYRMTLEEIAKKSQKADSGVSSGDCDILKEAIEHVKVALDILDSQIQE